MRGHLTTKSLIPLGYSSGSRYLSFLRNVSGKGERVGQNVCLLLVGQVAKDGIHYNSSFRYGRQLSLRFPDGSRIASRLTELS
ncbi:unnamed protein product [Taenia asiatica]|uniref:Uncharacterized protein n=1 Tax=Taenia asiatica TaxID=60517 RepID=A0A3P6P7W7_TAEAS|nr:unnamed protein product [Taenia asiatica]